MRAIRMAATMVACLVLIGAGSVTGAAQEVADPMAPASFTFTLEPVEETSGRHMPEVIRGYEEANTVEATDPRVSGLLTSTMNWNWAVGGDTGVLTAASSERLTNEDGAWVGEGRQLLTGVDGSSRMNGLFVLAGEGSYEGLTLILSRSWDAGTDVNWGVIVPDDQLPPIPEPVTAPAG